MLEKGIRALIPSGKAGVGAMYSYSATLYKKTWKGFELLQSGK